MGTENNLLLCAKKLPSEVLTEFCGLCVEEGFRILDDTDIITTTPAYLTATYLNCAKWIGFTVQMYMCMGVFFLLSMYFLSSSLLECVSEAFSVSLLTSTVSSCLAGLLLSPGIYCFHNFPV